MIKVSVNKIITYNITFYAKAGDTISGGEEFNVYYSTDGSNYTYLAGPLYSTYCTQLSTVALPSPFWVWVKRDIYNDSVYIAYTEGGQCPPNNNDVCGPIQFYPYGNEDLGLTVYVNNGAMSTC